MAVRERAKEANNHTQETHFVFILPDTGALWKSDIDHRFIDMVLPGTDLKAQGRTTIAKINRPRSFIIPEIQSETRSRPSVPAPPL